MIDKTADTGSVPSPCSETVISRTNEFLLYAVAVIILVVMANRDYLLFHSLAELFSVVVAFGIFVIGWNSRKYYKNNYLLFIGIAYLFVAFFDTLHTLAYKGMGVFKGYDDNNLPPQLWLVARYLESISLLIAPFYFNIRFSYRRVIIVFSAVSLVALYAIFYAQIFPTCFITGSGLTPFKRLSEYTIDLILLFALVFLHKRKEHFEPGVLRLLTYSILCTMVTELCFTMYVHLYGISNLLGHLFKIFSFIFMYKAIIQTALEKPYDLLFKELSDRTNQLSETLDINQKIISESQAGILAYRADTGACVLANESAARTVGSSVDYMLTQCFREINSWKQSGLLETAEQVISTGKSVRKTLRLITTFGRDITCDFSFSLFSSNGEKHLLLIYDDISERLANELKIETAEAFTRSVINSLSAHIAVLDKAGTIIMVNDAWRNFAVENNGDLRKTCENSNYLTACTIPDDDVDTTCRDSLQAIIDGNLADYKYEYACDTPDGKAFYFLMRAVPLKFGSGGAVVSHYDISARKQMELALLTGEERYRSLFNGMTEGFALHEIICDDQGVPCDYRFIDINPAFERLTGFEREAVIGKRVTELLPNEDSQWIERYGAVALTGNSIHFENYSPVLQKHYEVFAYKPAPLQFAVLFIDVTERKGLEARLATVMRQQNLILENASVGITFVVDRIQIWANPKMGEMFGYSQKEMEQQSTRMFYPSQETFEEIGKAAYSVLSRGEIHTVVCNMQRRDGSVFWTKLCGKAIDPDDLSKGSIWIFEDITDQKWAEEALIQSRNRLNEAQRIAHVGNWELDIVADILEWSDEIYRIFEIDSAQFGASYSAFLNAIHPDDRERVNDAYAKSLETRTAYSITHRLLMPDGRIKYVCEQCETVFDDAGKPLRSSGTVQDITHLENARLAAETASKVKSEFLTNMSHEIRTPMNGILGMAQLLRNTALSEIQKEQIDIIIMSGNDLLRQLNDILNFSRMESEQITLDYAPLSLEQCIHDVISAQQALISAKGLATSVTVADDVPDLVLGDAFRIRQILFNLVGNAIKFTEQGGINVEVNSLEQEGAVMMVTLAIHDTGIGISEDALDAIFQPFVQADGSINRKFGGTGLGLSISSKLARLMGGDITCESRGEAGSSFYFRLPCHLID